MTERTNSFGVLVADAIGDEGVSRLTSVPGLSVELAFDITAEQLLQRVTEQSALVVRSRTKVPAELLEVATKLRVIARAGSGVDNIDVSAATKHGVIVMNTPGANTNAAVEQTLALMLALARHLPQADRHVREGSFEPKRFLGTELKGKTLGVIGLGKIGSEVAERARAFGMQIVGFDPLVAAQDTNVRLLPLTELYAIADYVTLHLPLTAETHHLIGAEVLALMKPTARLINCARGGLVDEGALVEALDAGRLAGAAFDVFETEPRLPKTLLQRDDVIVTPHLGAQTVEARAAVGIMVAEQVRAALLERRYVNVLNTELMNGAP